MSVVAAGGQDLAIADGDRRMDLGTWRRAHADLVNDDAAAAWFVRRVQAGDGRAFDVLDQAFRPGVYRYLRATLRNADDAQEVCQLTFMRALEKIHTCRIAAESFAAWLYGIARNAGIDHLRKHVRTTVEDPALIDLRRDEVDPRGEPLVGAWGSRDDLHGELERLPEVQRSVIVLRYLVGLTAAEVGEVLGYSADSVRHFHQRAMRTLRRGPLGGSRLAA